MMQNICRRERPIGIAQHFTRHQNNVRAAIPDDPVRLHRICDIADRGRHYSCFVSNPFSKRHLESGTEGNGSVIGRVEGGTAIDQIDPLLLEQLG